MTKNRKNPFDVMEKFTVDEQEVFFYSLKKLQQETEKDITRLPFSIKILLEAVLRNVDGEMIKKEDIEAIINWQPKKKVESEIPFIPSRVILQDFTGVPAVVDLAAMRSALDRFEGDPARINPLVPVDLVIDHSIQVDHYGSDEARNLNEQKEFERNEERYALLRWAQKAFDNFRVVPPGRGIVHQINLEFLASVVHRKKIEKKVIAYPDTLVGTDSHTTMINSLGVLGWGVGGIEAEAVMLGQPYYMPLPDVIGVKFTGELQEGVTATDLVLTVTKMLREYGVVGKFVEFFGPGLQSLTLPDRATIANMSPEYGATMGFFPIDQQTLNYLSLTGRSEQQIKLIKNYCQKQGLFLQDYTFQPEYTDVLELALETVEPSLAGPKRPQDRIALGKLKDHFHQVLENVFSQDISVHELLHDEAQGRWDSEGGCTKVEQFSREDSSYQNWFEGKEEEKSRQGKNNKINDGSVIIAAITSCTNTSNPFVLIGAGLLAKNAVEKGLTVKPFVKTSLAPGSRVVTDYIKKAGLMTYLEQLGFNVVGYGCTTCIGNSGPIDKKIVQQIKEEDLVVASVLSGNRNFEGRINPYTKANYLTSPILVVAFALAGTIDINLTQEPLGKSKEGEVVYLKDIWPKRSEIEKIVDKIVTKEMFKERYADVFQGSKLWQELKITEKKSFEWDESSTYIHEPPFFVNFPKEPPELANIQDAYVLALLGDTITTDHISPAGAIPKEEPAGQYLQEQGVRPKSFNSYGSRRGNHEVMMRGTFGNIRLKNKLVTEKEGGWTKHHPSNEIMPIYDAAMKYKENNNPLLVIAGKEYGTGSSRDWAAKGTLLLGVKAVIAESYERIHRSNLVGMGVLPLEFLPEENAETLGLKGEETYDIIGIDNLTPRKKLTVIVKEKDKKTKQFSVVSRLDSEVEINYYRNGGILHTVLRNLLHEN